ncbi:MAG: 3-dehydroquinate synthase, partial [Akkermansiaceae bacterium]
MQGKDFEIRISSTHRVRFTRDAFSVDNRMLLELLETNGHAKLLTFIDQGVADAFPDLPSQVETYLDRMPGFQAKGIITLQGGEFCKRDANTLQTAWDAIEAAGIDRHSYILCIGGGAFLDVIGLAAATAHRGIRLVRFPTTSLAQDDSGVGVKNGINAYGKKNFLGSFAVPYAVVNDFSFLSGLPETECRAGLVEAVKVALVKDASLFHWIEDNIGKLAALEDHALEEVVERSALLHASHIAYGGDPYETGSSRPLDFGHWAAHKMEQLTDFALSHADAVGVGVALDTIYSWKTGRLEETSAMRILNVLTKIKLPLWHQALDLQTADGS